MLRLSSITFTDADSLSLPTQLCITLLEAANGILEKESDLSIPTINVTRGSRFSGEGFGSAVGSEVVATGGGGVGLITRRPDCAIAIKVKLSTSPATKSDASKTLDCFVMVLSQALIKPRSWRPLYHLTARTSSIRRMEYKLQLASLGRRWPALLEETAFEVARTQPEGCTLNTCYRRIAYEL
jgi:hypothetical protein